MIYTPSWEGFSTGTAEHVRPVPSRMTLIGGRRLIELMNGWSVGVQAECACRLGEIDRDFVT